MKFLKKYAAFSLLVIDEWLLDHPDDAMRSMLLELLERRYVTGSTVFCTQYAKKAGTNASAPECTPTRSWTAVWGSSSSARFCRWPTAVTTRSRADNRRRSQSVMGSRVRPYGSCGRTISASTGHERSPKAARCAGHDIGRGQVARLMRAGGTEGVRRSKRVRITRPDRGMPRHPDLVRRDFTTTAPTDLTFVPTWAGVAYVCFIIDAFSRAIVGWRVASRMRTTMVLDAIEMVRR